MRTRPSPRTSVKPRVRDVADHPAAVVPLESGLGMNSKIASATLPNP